MDNRTAVYAFLQDVQILEPITQSVSKINIFKVLRLQNNEVRHSNMLAWLINPNENHGLGDRVLRGLIQLVDENPPESYDDFSIRPEANHIDLLAVSGKGKYVLSIENKTFTGEHDNQLARYKTYVEGTYSDYRKRQIFLSPKGKKSSDPEQWVSVSYGDVARIIEEAKKEVVLQPQAELYIDNYLEVIKELSGGDERIKSICVEVYRKHQQALDLILQYANEDDQAIQENEEGRLCKEIYQKYQIALDKINEYKPGKERDRIASIVREWADRWEDEGIIEVCQQKVTERRLLFKTPKMSELLPDIPGIKSAWKTENFYFYELFNKNPSSDEHMLFLQLSIGAENMPEDLRRMSDRINDVSSESVEKENWKYRINFTTNYVPISVNADKQTVMDILDGFLKQVFAYEEDLFTKLR